MGIFSNKTGRPKIGLALGSGGSHGLAHIGVIKTLIAHDIPIDYIAGSSAGALVGGLYAAHQDIEAVERVALTSDIGRIIRFMTDVSVRGGLLSGYAIERFIRHELDSITFDQLRIPLVAVATDIHTGEAILLREGDVTAAIRASMSVPLVFEPVSRDSRLLVDGGLAMPVPVAAVRAMGADIVVGVNLETRVSQAQRDASPTITTIAAMTMDILRSNFSTMQAYNADLVVSPHFDGKVLVGWNEFLHAQDFIERGQVSMEKAMPHLQQLLSKE